MELLSSICIFTWFYKDLKSSCITDKKPTNCTKDKYSQKISLGSCDYYRVMDLLCCAVSL